MSFDFDSEAKLNQFGARFSVSNIKRKEAADFIERMAFDRLRDQLASELSRNCMRVTENVYSTDYEIRVYVLTPDQLEKYVQRRAERMRMGGPYAVVEQSYVK